MPKKKTNTDIEQLRRGKRMSTEDKIRWLWEALKIGRAAAKTKK